MSEEEKNSKTKKMNKEEKVNQNSQKLNEAKTVKRKTNVTSNNKNSKQTKVSKDKPSKNLEEENNITYNQNNTIINNFNNENEKNNNSKETSVTTNEKSKKTEEINHGAKKQNGFVTFLKSFTPYQIVYLSSVIVLVILFSIFLPNEMLETDNTFVIICSVIAVIANPLCELMISKQNKWNFIVSIVFIEVTECIIAVSMGHIATAVVSIVFWIPIDLVSFFKWKEHPDKEEEIVTQVKRLNWWQDILIVLAICAFGFGVGYLLQLTPVAEDTYWDAFATAFGMANGILLLTRYNEQWFAWGFSLIFTAIAYIVGGAYIMLITVGAMMVNTIYGFVKWIIYIKKHKSETINTTPKAEIENQNS